MDEKDKLRLIGFDPTDPAHLERCARARAAHPGKRYCPVPTPGQPGDMDDHGGPLAWALLAIQGRLLAYQAGVYQQMTAPPMNDAEGRGAIQELTIALDLLQRAIAHGGIRRRETRKMGFAPSGPMVPGGDA